MEYALKERIGKPELFVGRQKELDYFLKWINDIKDEKSRSIAIPARRKSGKTALMQRLFNITFARNDGVIPFYYEVNDNSMYLGDFCNEFFLTFIYQYIAFKTRKTEYLKPAAGSGFAKAFEIAKKEGFGYLCDMIDSAEQTARNNNIDNLWNLVREAPQTVAFWKNEFIVQMIDEFQFLNSMIFWDKEKKNPATTLAGGYHSTAESKIAPLLVSGSWVGWLMNLLKKMLPTRFKYKAFLDMPQDEAVEMIYKYSQFFEVPVTEETVYLMASLCEGSPFYISSMILSECPDKDLTSIDGLTRTLEFETLDNHGNIKTTWMDYVNSAFSIVNNRNAKRIVLHLCKNKGRELTRKELIDALQLDMTDEKLEEKMEALVNADIINQGISNYRYSAVSDNIFDKVFRGIYQEEIDNFNPREIHNEYKQAFEDLKKEYDQLKGKLNYLKGYYTEYVLIDQLKINGLKKNDQLKAITRNLPADFNFCLYSRVWRYDATPEYRQRFNIDLYARAKDPTHYSIIGEVKCRDTKKFSQEELDQFLVKFHELKKIENLDRVIPFVYSRSGFTQEVEDYCRENGIACSEDERWLS